MVKYDAQKGTQFVFSDLGTYQPGDGWNVYSEIKRKLTEDYGIPPSEVRFIQECKTDKARKAVIDAMNAGTVRVLFGATSMLGTGVNAQMCIRDSHNIGYLKDITPYGATFQPLDLKGYQKEKMCIRDSIRTPRSACHARRLRRARICP